MKAWGGYWGQRCWLRGQAPEPACHRTSSLGTARNRPRTMSRNRHRNGMHRERLNSRMMSSPTDRAMAAALDADSSGLPDTPCTSCSAEWLGIGTCLAPKAAAVQCYLTLERHADGSGIVGGLGVPGASVHPIITRMAAVLQTNILEQTRTATLESCSSPAWGA
eukprot:1845280-Rhodomonas_salina.2